MERTELLKKSKRILFNADMRQAIWDDQKTEFRKIVKNIPEGAVYVWHEDGRFRWSDGGWQIDQESPYQKGDILYVPEGWKCCTAQGKKVIMFPDGEVSASEADDIKCMDVWQSPYSMPKRAARLFLRIVEVRPEKLQDITIEGCQAEGIWDDYKTLSQAYHDLLMQVAYRETFRNLWDSSMHKKNREKFGWKANPYVWAVAFEKIHFL